ncbi:MCP four helix bundle domain-containing protein, partial [Amorphus orientalis]
MKIIGKISAIVAVLGLATVTLGGIAYYSVNRLDAAAERLDAASQRAYLLERINRHITAVVMDARGTYMSTTPERAERFAAGIMNFLDELDKDVADLAPLVPPSERAMFDAMVADLQGFREFRSETARLAVEEGGPAANAQGNTDANRANRKALQATVDAYTTEVQNTVQEARSRASAFANRISTVVIFATVLSLLIGVAIAMVIGIRS